MEDAASLGPWGFHSFSESALYLTTLHLDFTVWDITAPQVYIFTLTAGCLSETTALVVL